MSSVCLSVCLPVCPSVTLVNCDHIGWNSFKIISPSVSLGRSLFATPTWRVCSKGNTPKFWPKVTHPPVDLSVGDIRSQIAPEWLQISQRSQWRAYRKLPSLFLMVPSLTPYDLSFPPKRGFHMPPTYANGHISVTGDPIHFMFGSRVGFSGKADRTALFTIRTNPRWRPPLWRRVWLHWARHLAFLGTAATCEKHYELRQPPSWKNFKWPYLRNRSSDPLPVWLKGGVFGDGGSNGAIFDSNKFKMAAAAILDHFEWPYLLNGSRSTYISAHRAVIFAIAQLSCLQ